MGAVHMLKLDATLPHGALLGQTRAGFRAALDPSAIWLPGDVDAFTYGDAGEIISWTDGIHSTLLTEPNTGNTRPATGPRPGMICEAGVHCGMVLPSVTDHAARCSMALVYTPAPDTDASTLLTLNTHYVDGVGQDGTYLFLSDREEDGFLVKDTGGHVMAQMPGRPATGAPRLLVVTLSGTQLALAVDLDPPVVTKGTQPGLDCAADLFIGCRSHRGGLKRTVGQSVIHDVMFWPKHTLLIPRTEDDHAQYAALKQFHLWGDNG